LLLFTTDLEIGGTPTVVRELAMRLNAGGIETHVGCLGRFGPIAEELAAAGVIVWALDASPRRVWWAAGELWRRAEPFSHCLSFLMHANAVAALAGGVCGRFQSVQTTQLRPVWHWPMQAIAARRAARVICCSDSVAAAARRRSFVSAEKLMVIPNAVDAADVAEAPKPLIGGRLRVGFLGRLDPVKRLELLIDAVAELPDAELHVHGDGPERRRLEARAAGQRVIFHGFTDRAAALANIDVLALTSRWEGMPMVLVEAMAAGVPVVGVDVPGVRDVIRHDANGLLTSPENLAATLARLRDPTTRARLAAAALAEVRERYLWPAILRQYRQALGFGDSGNAT
jgi:glycosyltransferase involved in cell wall biosynthesis